MAFDLTRFRPEIGAGGYARHDNDVAFYTRVRAIIQPDFTVLDLGAGRGSFAEDPVSIRRELRALKGRVRRLVGCDIDPAVLSNETVDERVVLEAGKPLPFPPSSFDVVICDWVFEHVENPEQFAEQLVSIVRPQGWICARTPNRLGLTGLGVTLVPKALHDRVLKYVWPERNEVDVFPKYYRLNSISDVARAFGRMQWQNHSYAFAGEPKYHANSSVLFRLFALWNRLMPDRLASELHIFLQRKVDAPTV